MSRDQFWLTDAQFLKIAPHLPTDTRGKARVDDRRVISGIVHVLKSGSRWVDAPPDYGPKKTLYNRFVGWADKGVWTTLVPSVGAGWRAIRACSDRQFRGQGPSFGGGRKRGRKIRPLAAREAVARPRSTRRPMLNGARSLSC